MGKGRTFQQKELHMQSLRDTKALAWLVRDGVRFRDMEESAKTSSSGQESYQAFIQPMLIAPHLGP